MPGSLHTSPTPVRSRWRIATWTTLWGLLALLHVTQSIWTSGGRAYPGDLGDGRFNQLVLEHGHQSLRGMARWDSPRQFYPVSDTLSFSDTHAGTLPIYTGLRRLALSREEAWQLWFVIVAGFNTWACFRWVAALRIAAVLRGPLVFASAGSASMVWVAGTHMQLLPVFPTLLAWEQMLRWKDDRQPWRLLAIAGWTGWQFAASPYVCFAAGVITALAVAAYLLASRESLPPEVTQDRTAPWLGWIGTVSVLLIGGTLAVAASSIHLAGIRHGHSRGTEELIELAPTFASWFRAAPGRLFPAPVRVDWTVNLSEHAWFAGWLPWLLLGPALIAAWRRRADSTARCSLAFGLASLGAILLFTKASADGTSLWIWIAAHVESLRAFRATGRVAEFLPFTLAATSGLLLTELLAVGRRHVTLILVVALATAIAFENLTFRQPATAIAVARGRTAGLVAAWQKAGDRPVLVYAPGKTTEPAAWIHLDAWSAALQLHRATINGYSGAAPSSHLAFALVPSLDNARRLLAATGIPEDSVSVVVIHAESAAAKLAEPRASIVGPAEDKKAARIAPGGS